MSRTTKGVSNPTSISRPKPKKGDKGKAPEKASKSKAGEKTKKKVQEEVYEDEDDEPENEKAGEEVKEKGSKVAKAAKTKQSPVKPTETQPQRQNPTNAGTKHKSVKSTSDSTKSLKAKPSKNRIAELKTVEEAEDQLPNEKEKDSEDENEDEDEEGFLHGFSTASESSDEGEDDGVDDAPIDVTKLPTIAKDDASVKRKLDKAKRKTNDSTGVVYLGRIPHGFYEDQMKAYFSQFGDVTRLRLSRNKRTGRSKHYGFIEFASSAVAEIVADTMNNYLLMGHIMRCKIIPEDQVHRELWAGANKKWHRVPFDRIERLRQNKTRTDAEQKQVEKRLLKRQQDKKRKLAAAGIEYDFDSVAYTKKKKVDDE